MTTIYVDPSSATNGAGTLLAPRNTVPTSVAYGDYVLFKGGTTMVGGWTVPAPSGTPSLANVLTIGTYDPLTGEQNIFSGTRAKIVAANGADAIYLNGRSYVTVVNLDLVAGRDYPFACVRAVAASYITVDRCVLSATYTGGGGGAYCIRFDNPTGTAATQTNWTVTRNTIQDTGGAQAILMIWGANSGENVSNIICSDNTISRLRDIGPTYTPDAIYIKGRASAYYTDLAGTTALGVQVNRNVISDSPSYGIRIEGASPGAIPNQVSGNIVTNTGDGTRDIHCIQLAACSGFTVEDNFIDGTTAYTNNTTGSGVGIFIDRWPNDRDGCQDITVRRNKVYRTGQGASLNQTTGGAGIFVLQSQQIIVESNMVAECKNGIVIQGGNGALDKSVDVDVFGNTVVDSVRSGIYVTRIADAVTVKNNAVSGGERGIYIENAGANPITNYTETYNSVHGTSSFAFSGGDEPTAGSATVSTRVQDGSNITADPLLSASYRPRAGSPLLAAGTFISYASRDVNGVQRPNPPSIGAYDVATLRTVA